MNDPNLHH